MRRTLSLAAHPSPPAPIDERSTCDQVSKADAPRPAAGVARARGRRHGGACGRAFDVDIARGPANARCPQAASSTCAYTHGSPRFLQGPHTRRLRSSSATRAESASQGRSASPLLWLAVVALCARGVAPQVANFTIALSSAPSVAPKSRYSPSVMGVNMGARPCARVAWLGTSRGASRHIDCVLFGSGRRSCREHGVTARCPLGHKNQADTTWVAYMRRLGVNGAPSRASRACPTHCSGYFLREAVFMPYWAARVSHADCTGLSCCVSQAAACLASAV